MNKPLEGKVALVTGGSRSLGRAIALKMADHGADVAITYRTKSDDAEETVARIKSSGRNAVALQADLEGTGDLKRFLETLEPALTEMNGAFELDILVNNAGIERGGAIGQVSEEDYDAIRNSSSLLRRIPRSAGLGSRPTSKASPPSSPATKPGG